MRRLLLCFWLVLSFGFAVAALQAEERQILPITVAPTHYDLTITPDTSSLTFKGVVRVALKAASPIREIVLNAKGLTFDHTTLDGVAARSVVLDDKLGRATLAFEKPIPAGPHQLAIEYHGPILKSTFGFFAMDYDSPAGKRTTLATNFEPTGARMLLPCWDEPARKATFTISIDAPKDRMAISNMPIAKVTPLGPELKRVRFAETPKMSTYLLFVSVGDYERVSRKVDKTDVGVVVKRGDVPRAAYALDQACALLHYYNDYFGLPFPLPKLDLIAAPGTITGGSMENWGSIFYSQQHLLFDPRTSTERDRQLVFLVVSHEMAHQWFGDLVTMAWWDNLWLNEGFARWMQTHAADALHSDWRTGLQAQRIYESGKRADAKPSTHPVLQPVTSAEQAVQAFDSITYNKGAAVVTMLEAYIGADAFREGVRHYMRAHAYGNTVDSDLWSEMQKVASKPIVEIESDFTRQAGLPFIRVTEAGDDSELTVSRFYEDPVSEHSSKQSWHSPVAISSPGHPDQMLLLIGHAKVPGTAPLVNVSGRSYARVFYSPNQGRALVARVSKIAPADQLNLINDSWALGQAGYASASDLLDYISALPADADPIVWSRACEVLVAIDDAYASSPQQEAFRHRALSLLAPSAARIGDAGRAHEDPAVTSLRSDLWLARARFGDAAALARGKKVYDAQTGSQEERRTALEIVARAADEETFNAFLGKARQTADPLDRNRILEALAGVADPKLAARFTEVALSADAPSGTAPSLLGKAAKTNPDAVWSALAPHLDDPNLPIDQPIRGEVISSIAGESSEL
ncbi:MAG TPA: M1 family metallopeptidase, partial [Chthoniobacterales bacterium]|nr:M1 family metallopeptidase [Chthoniobacterales bacterium]